MEDISKHSPGTPLTARWTVLKPHGQQTKLWTSPRRFCVVPAGRRSGKTELAKRRLVKAAMSETYWPDAWFVACAPTQSQAKRIYWRDLKMMVPKAWRAGKPNESELTINLINGASISVLGMDVPERVEGKPLNGIVCDEYGNMKKQAWTENIRPSLSDRRGWAWLIGVPEGRNHYYDVYCEARADTTQNWGAFTWKSADILPPEEIIAAQHDLDPLTYQQEYEADFVTFAGRAYYQFKAETHSAKRLTYNPLLDLIFCFDFNVSPGTATILQEQEGQTCVLDEVYVPNNSNTPLVCRKIIDGYKTHKQSVYCYGDATGGARGTAKVAGSDWDLIKQHLKPVFPDRVFFRVDSENPREKVRVNAMNSRLQSMAGDIRMLVDPVKAKMTVKDFEGVKLIEGSAGEIDKGDKDGNDKLTHLTDGIGYYIAKKYPVSGGAIGGSEEI